MMNLFLSLVAGVAAIAAVVGGIGTVDALAKARRRYPYRSRVVRLLMVLFERTVLVRIVLVAALAAVAFGCLAIRSQLGG